MQAELKLYTDASFDPPSKTAVTGFRPLDGAIVWKVVENTNNSRAELLAILLALESSEPGIKVKIFTDCKSAVNKLNSRNFERGQNRDLYEKISQYDVMLTHLKGHNRKEDRMKDPDLQQFSVLDKELRKRLRSLRD